MNTITIAEQFYSIQGEGPTSGVPAFFLRLTGCNLLCGGNGTDRDKQLHDGATWRCDTIEVWRKGETKSYEQILMDWANQSAMPIRDLLTRKEAHIVITGGEPLLQLKAVGDFLEWLYERMGKSPYVEIETNGTRLPDHKVNELVDQYNVSPKLSNSGMAPGLRINSEALRFFAKQENAFFKFVVSSSADVEEAFLTFIQPFDLNPRRVYLMPAAEDRDTLTRIGAEVAELCKREGFRYSNRMHLSIWNKKTGV